MIDTVLFDIDGVLTNGMVYIDSEGKESKKISFDDIDAIFELKRSGIKIGFITGEDNGFSEYVKKRFEPDYFVSGCKNKLAYFKELAEKEVLDKSKVCFVGDSKKDEELLRYLDYSFVPVDADVEVKKAGKFITNTGKGNGVIKEVAAFILRGRKNEKIRIDAKSLCRERIAEHREIINLLQNDEKLMATIEEVARTWIESLETGGKILMCGNGGSAADSQHLATELVSRFFMERKALDAEALTINTSTLTAVGNDYSFDKVFSRQVEAKGKHGDVLLGISTSGNSKNVVEAIKVAKEMNIRTIGMIGNNKESLIYKMADYCICVPSVSTPRIQEAHILIGHILCEIVEKQIFQN